MTDISRLIISVTTDGVRGATRELGKLTDKSGEAERATDKLKQRAEEGRRKFNLYGVAVVGLVATGLVALINGTVKADDHIAKLSTRLNISTEALSEYKHVAELTGVSFDTMTMAFQRVSRRVSEAAKGSGEAKDALIELGLSAEKLNQLTIDQQFEIITDRINGLGNEADKTRLAMRLFDSEGVALLQTMKGGSGAIKDMRKQARDLGLTLSGEDAKAAEEFNDSLTVLKATFTGVGNTIVHQLVKPLTTLAHWVNVSVLEFIDLGDMLGTYAAIAVKATQLDVNGIRAVIAERKAHRAALDDTIAGILGEKKAVEETSAAVKAAGPLELTIKPMVSKPVSDTYQSLLDDMQTEEDIIRESYVKRASIIDELEYNNEISAEERRLLHISAWQDYEAQLTAISERESQERTRAEEEAQRGKMTAIQSGLNSTASIFGSLATLVGNGSKKAFEMNKKLQRASIIASTAAGMIRAFADLPTPLAWGASAAIALQGAAALTQVNRLSFDGGGSISAGGAGGAGGTPAPVGGAGLNLGGSQNGGTGDTIVNVTVNGHVMGSDLETIVANALRDANDRDMVHVIVNGQRANVVTTNG